MYQYMDVDCERRQKKSSHSADCKQSNKAKRVKHRGVKGDGTFVEGRGPVEYLYRGGNCYSKTQKRKDHARVD